jgi:hypothetical protein
VSLPQAVEIRIPASELSLSIDMGTIEINTLAENPQLWALPSINGAPLTDLGAAPSTAATPAMGNQIAGADWYGPGPAVGNTPPIAPTPAATMPVQGVAAVALAPPPIAVQSSGPLPQFIQPAGVEIDPRPPMGSTPLPGTQQLPAGGVADSSAFVR